MPSLTHLWQAAGGVRRRGQQAVQRWTDRARKHPPFKRTLLFEALEQRILMSADIVGSIQVPGEVDKYVFTVTQDKQVYFDSLSNINMTWSLSGPQGAVVTDRSFRGSDSWDVGGNPIISLTAGDYLLSVDAPGDTVGDYSARLVDLVTAPSIVPGAPVSGALEPGNETDLYHFDAVAGERFFFDMRSIQNGDGTWRLISPDNTQLFQNPLYADVDVLTLPTTGSYTLLLEGRYYASGRNPYEFNIQPVSDDVAGLALGETINGAIDLPGQSDRYTFSLGDAKQVYFDSLINNGNFTWSLAGPHGTLASSRNFITSDSAYVAGNPFLSLAAGDYVLTVETGGDITGNYSFRLLDMSSATVLTPGTTVSGQLAPANETDLYKFDAIAGDRYYFDQQTISGGATYWRLLDPNGQVVFGPNGFSDVDTIMLSATGTYRLLVEGVYYASSYSSAADYSFSVNKVNDDAAELVLGARIDGTIAPAGQVDRSSSPSRLQRCTQSPERRPARSARLPATGADNTAFGSSTPIQFCAA